jgi:dipeptidyl aminopeptidase/acylaminoacyl peptidase
MRRLRLRIGLLALGLALLVGGVAVAARPYHLSKWPPAEPAKRGVVITVHGGGWEGNYGAAADQLMGPYIQTYRKWGFRVYNLAHRPGRKSLVDMIDAVERVSRRHPTSPLCLFGGSSGGHLVLMAAAERPKLIDCVINQAGTPDLVNPDSAPGWQHIHDTAVRYWGRANLRDVSPMQNARDIRAPVLVIQPDCDFATTVARQQKFVNKIRRGTLLVQEGGEGFNTGHCELTWESVIAGVQAQHDFFDRYAG